VTRQFRELGLPGPDDLALALVGAYQGTSLVASADRGAEIMTCEGSRLTHLCVPRISSTALTSRVALPAVRP
jgi:hypothetical protein